MGEVSPKVTERASPSPKSIYTAIRTGFCQSDAIAVFLFFCNGLALSVSLRSPAPPKGEPLACRVTFRWTPKARQGAKERASLTGAAASGQEHLVKLS